MNSGEYLLTVLVGGSTFDKALDGQNSLMREVNGSVLANYTPTDRFNQDERIHNYTSCLWNSIIHAKQFQSSK